MTADIAQQLMMKRLEELLDKLISQTDQFYQRDTSCDLGCLDFESVPVFVGYLRDVGLRADAERIQNEFNALFVRVTDTVFTDYVQSEPESEDFFRETFGIPPLASDPESQIEIQESRKMACCAKSLRLRELLTGLRQLLTKAQSSDDGAKVNRPSVAKPSDAQVDAGNLTAALHATSPGATTDESTPVTETPADEQQSPDNYLPQYVTLDKMAAIVSRSKKTLERLKKKLPSPDVDGGGGKPDEWIWCNVRECLMTEYGKQLPERYPSLRKPLMDTDGH